MQDIHSLAGGGAATPERLFVAAAVTGNGRLLRPISQALKCPRCDSLNTKFCYYNNYNLSQPRHFCKSCRRYWTKGGVLRNVPVGGGCRKSKRSSSKSMPTKPPPSPSADDASAYNFNHPSRGSSVIPAAANIPTIFHEVRSTSTVSSLYGVEDTEMDHQQQVGCGEGRDEEAGMMMMMTEMGNLPSLMGSTTVDVEGFGTLDWEGSGGASNGGDRGEGMLDTYWNQWTADDDLHPRGGVDDVIFLP